MERFHRPVLNSFDYVAAPPSNPLILVFVFSPEVPFTGCAFKESVKILPSESPASANEPALELSTAEVLPHSARMEAEDFCGFADRQEMFPDRCRLRFLFFHLDHSTR